MTHHLCFIAILMPLALGQAAEFHVAITGSDSSPGTPAAPLRTIQHAADLAQPGDTVTVHAGVYRERINPPRGGASDARRIVYQAAPGEKVVITGSEQVKKWEKVQDGVWKATLPNTFFGSFNPFAEVISGDWFDARGRNHHAGAVYLNGDWLTEAVSLEELLKPMTATPLWFATVDTTNTVIWTQFKDADPNAQQVEVNVSRSVFYPKKPGMNFITVRGFTLRNAATPWAPPTVEQIGLIGVHWSKGWIIENNDVAYSTCSGITLGKYGEAQDEHSASAMGYVGTIERGFKNGWNKETVGHHVVRNNHIAHCEQAGIVGSLGAAFSTITGNTIHDIHVRQLFSGAEMAGIKFHGPIDTTISGNHIYRTCRGIWLDWMTQGARISNNLCHDNEHADLMVEANHGPFVVDNNTFLSPKAIEDPSQGGAYAHNLIAGGIDLAPKVAVLLCGINNFGVTNSAGGKETWDLGVNCPPLDIANGSRAIAQVFRRRLPETRLIMMALLPVADEVKWAKCRQVNAINAAQRHNANEVAYVDLQDKFLLADGSINKQLFTDGIHLTAEGYRVWAKGIEPLVVKFMKAPPLDPMKIMLIGDSVTEGLDSDGSYRRYLDGMLRRQGHLIDFVGSRRKHNDDKTEPINYEYDVDHEGHWGKNSTWLAENMPGLLTSNVPDVAVIHLGTEDILSSKVTAEALTDGIVQNLGKLINTLLEKNGNLKIVISAITPVPGKEDVVKLLNLTLSRYVQSHSTLLHPVLLANQSEGFDVSLDLTTDGTLPNAGGARKMARVFADVIQKILRNAEHEERKNRND